MKRILNVLALLACVCLAQAQAQHVKEKMPEYPGGMQACMKFLGEHIRYPETALNAGIEGRVITNVVIDQYGSVVDVEVLEGVSPELDAEAVRVLRMMPKWTPGMKDGKPVRVKYTIPINFRIPKEVNNAPMYKVVEEMPEYPGGMQACMRFLGEHIRYPESALKAGVEGKVLTSIVVDQYGSVVNVEVLQGVSPELDAEAVRVLRMMPKWKPGTQNGKPIRVRFSIPINFRLPEDVKKEIRNASLAQSGGDKALSTEPEFPGGKSACLRFIAENLQYPKQAQMTGEQGRVIVGFFVEEDGSITNVEIEHSVGPFTDKEALRVVGLMPKWTPGMKGGKPVRVKAFLPVMFSLTP